MRAVSNSRRVSVLPNSENKRLQDVCHNTTEINFTILSCARRCSQAKEVVLFVFFTNFKSGEMSVKKDPECVKVVVRCRPLSRKEVEDSVWLPLCIFPVSTWFFHPSKHGCVCNDVTCPLSGWALGHEGPQRAILRTRQIWAYF